MADLDDVSQENRVNSGHMLSDDEIARRGLAALADRRARGEIMTYDRDGWVVREFPGRRIVRLCRAEDFRAEDHPYPSCPD